MFAAQVQSKYGREFFNGLNDFSSKEGKQIAYTAIYEGIKNCYNTMEDLEKKVAECNKAIIYWKSYHNSLSNISRLPDELLVEIWKHLACNPDRVSMQWLRVTHVCSGWRRVALNSPVLWSFPPLHCPQVASQLLERAKASKLTLVIDADELSDLSGDKGNPAMALASSILPNTEAIFLTLPSFGVGEIYYLRHIRTFLTDLCQDGATRSLRTLKVAYPECLSPEVGRTELDVVDVLQGSPQLQSLMLENRTPFDSPIQLLSISSLTSLEIFCDKDDLNQTSSIRKVLETLRYLTSLRTLWLFNVIRPLEDEDISWQKSLRSPVSLITLCNLSLQASTQISHLFFDSIQYPPTAVIDIQCLFNEAAGYTSNIDSLRNLLAVVTPRVTPALRFLGLSVDEDDDWSLSFDNHPDAYTSTEQELRIFLPPALQELQVISELPHLCPLRNLEHIEYELSVSNMDIWKAFGNMPNLRIIDLDPDLHPTFWKVYATLHPSGDTVFEPSTLPNPFQPNQNPTGADSLYYSRSDFEVILAVDNDLTEWRAWEEFDRIRTARRVWASNAGKYLEEFEMATV